MYIALASLVLLLFVLFVGFFLVKQRNDRLMYEYGSIHSSDFEQNTLDVFERPDYTFSYPISLSSPLSSKDEKNQDINSWIFDSKYQTLTLKEIPLNKYDDKAILKMVPANAEAPTQIEEIKIGDHKVTEAVYWLINDKQDFKAGDDGDGFYPAFGYLVTLPKTKLFFLFSGKLANRDTMIDTILPTLKNR